MAELIVSSEQTKTNTNCTYQKIQKVGNTDKTNVYFCEAKLFTVYINNKTIPLEKINNFYVSSGPQTIITVKHPNINNIGVFLYTSFKNPNEELIMTHYIQGIDIRKLNT